MPAILWENFNLDCLGYILVQHPLIYRVKLWKAIWQLVPFHELQRWGRAFAAIRHPDA